MIITHVIARKVVVTNSLAVYFFGLISSHNFTCVKGNKFYIKAYCADVRYDIISCNVLSLGGGL